MEYVEHAHFVTDYDEVENGFYSAKKYAKRFENFYGKDAEVNALKPFILSDEQKEKYKFTITDVNQEEKLDKLIYDIEPANKKLFVKITCI